MGQDSSRAEFHGILDDWLARLPTPEGKPFLVAFEHGTLSVELFAPRGVDTQQPHTRDEVYVVARGEGFFVNGSYEGVGGALPQLLVSALRLSAPGWPNSPRRPGFDTGISGPLDC